MVAGIDGRKTARDSMITVTHNRMVLSVIADYNNSHSFRIFRVILCDILSANAQEVSMNSPAISKNEHQLAQLRALACFEKDPAKRLGAEAALPP